MAKLASRADSRLGSRLLAMSTITGFSASTTSLAASGSVLSKRQYTYARSRRSGLSVSYRVTIKGQHYAEPAGIHRDPSYLVKSKIDQPPVHVGTVPQIRVVRLLQGYQINVNFTFSSSAIKLRISSVPESLKK